MKAPWLIGALAVGLWLVWRKPSDAEAVGGSDVAVTGPRGIVDSIKDAANNFTAALTGQPAKSADGERSGNANDPFGGPTPNTSPPVNFGGVTNNTNSSQNTATFGSGSQTEIGRELVIGGTVIGPTVGLFATPAPDPVYNGTVQEPNQIPGGSGITNTTNNTQNTVVIGDNGILHVGSGRRPAQDSDLETFWSNHLTDIAPGSGVLGGRGASDTRLGSIFNSATDFSANYRPSSGQFQRFAPASGSFYNSLVSWWNNLLGNTIAFPGQPPT